jgi:hypothetical protein
VGSLALFTLASRFFQASIRRLLDPRPNPRIGETTWHVTIKSELYFITTNWSKVMNILIRVYCAYVIYEIFDVYQGGSET